MAAPNDYHYSLDAGRDRQDEGAPADLQEDRCRSPSPPLEKDSRRDHGGDQAWAPPAFPPCQAPPTYPAYSYQQQTASYDWESNGRGYALPEPTRTLSDYPAPSSHHLAHAYAEPPRYARPSFAPYTPTSSSLPQLNSLPPLSSHLSSLPPPTFSSALPPFALHPLQIQALDDRRPQHHLPPHHSAPSRALPADWAIIANHGHSDEQAGREEHREGESKWQWSHSSSHVSSQSWNAGPISNGPQQAWDPLPRQGGPQDGGAQHWAGSSMGSLQAISRAASHAASGEQVYRTSEGSNGGQSRGSYTEQRVQEGYDYGTGGSESGSMGGGREKQPRKQRRRNGQPPRDLALRRYACELCVEEPRSFARPSALKIHMLTHTEEKPHICPVCTRAFAILSNLKRHRKLHDAEEQAAAAERQGERWVAPKAAEAAEAW